MAISWLLIALSSLAALALTLLPLPAEIQVHNPQWLLLVVIFWSLYRPAQAGLLYAWIAGLLLDVATNGLLGLNALMFAVTAFLTLSLRQRIAVAPLLSQALLVAGFSLIYLMVILWVEGGFNDLASIATYLSRALSNLAAWPVVHFLLGRLARLSER